MKKLLLLLLLILIGCSEPETKPETKPEIDFSKIDLSGINHEPRNINTLNFRNETYYPLNSDEGYSGPVYSYYDNSRGLYFNGGLKEEGTLKNGKPNGLWKEYYTSGQWKSKGTWKDGKRDGLFKGYYENGQIELEGTYNNGKRNGLWISYNRDDGDVESETMFEDGERTTEKFSGQDSQFRIERIYEDDKVKNQKVYDKNNGKILREETFKDGEIIDRKIY